MFKEYWCAFPNVNDAWPSNRDLNKAIWCTVWREENRCKCDDWKRLRGDFLHIEKSAKYGTDHDYNSKRMFNIEKPKNSILSKNDYTSINGNLHARVAKRTDVHGLVYKKTPSRTKAQCKKNQRKMSSQ